jgi:hypothetical protein
MIVADYQIYCLLAYGTTALATCFLVLLTFLIYRKGSETVSEMQADRISPIERTSIGKSLVRCPICLEEGKKAEMLAHHFETVGDENLKCIVHKCPGCGFRSGPSWAHYPHESEI